MTDLSDPSYSGTFETKKDGPNLVEGTPFMSAREIPNDDPQRTTWAGVPVTTTVLPLGGLRYWFACPRCHRRVGKLYDVSGPSCGWGCRRCHRLTYQSQHICLSTNPLLRSLQLLDRLDALEARYRAGDPAALKPLRKLVDRMWKDIGRDRASPKRR